MKELENVKQSLMNMMQKGVQAQSTTWYSFFNHTGALGDNFSNSLMNYVRMAFFSFVLANGKECKENRFMSQSTSGTEQTNELFNTVIKDLLQLGGRVVYNTKGIDDWVIDCFVSFDTVVVYIERTLYNLHITTFSMDEILSEKISKVINKEA